jgi:hypothetical protein
MVGILTGYYLSYEHHTLSQLIFLSVALFDITARERRFEGMITPNMCALNFRIT